MKPVDLIAAALADAVTLCLDSGKLRIRGNVVAVNRWLPLIRVHKAEIIEVLKPGTGGDAMSRSNLIREKSEPARFATATPATFATQVRERGRTAAKSPERKTATEMGEAEQVIRAWLFQIEEIDPAIIAEILQRCRGDKDALAYFLRRASGIDPGEPVIESHDPENSLANELGLVVPHGADKSADTENHG